MKQKLFLIRATSGKEIMIKLPVNRYGSITQKGFKIISERFYDRGNDIRHNWQYALCLEDYSSGKDLMKAIENYQKNTI